MTALERTLVVAAIVLAIAAVAWYRHRRRVAGFEPGVPALGPNDLPAPLTAPLTVLFFTSRLCSACKETPAVVAAAAPEVPAVPVDVREHAALTAKVGVFETPTLLLVDTRGRIRYAHVGNPDAAELWTYIREAWDSLEFEGELERRAHAGHD